MERLRRRAASLNAHATTSIEGNPLSREEVERLAERPARKGALPEELEIRLHLRYFDKLAKRPPPGALGLDEIRGTHAQLLTGVLSAGVGEWKRKQNVVVDEQGREIVYPSPPERVAPELEALSAWFEASPLPTPVRSIRSTTGTAARGGH